MRSLTFSLACLAFISLTTTSVHAQAADEYGTAVDAAVAAYNMGDYEGSARAFEGALRLRPGARPLLGLGRALVRAHHAVDAMHALEASLTEPRGPLNPTQRAEAVTLLGEAQTLTSWIRFVIQPDEARVRVDGRLVDASDPVLVDRGAHQIEVSAANYATSTRQFLAERPQHEIRSALTSLRPRAPLVAAPSDGMPSEAVAFFVVAGGSLLVSGGGLLWHLDRLGELDRCAVGGADHCATSSRNSLEIGRDVSLGVTIGGAIAAVAASFTAIAWPSHVGGGAATAACRPSAGGVFCAF